MKAADAPCVVPQAKMLLHFGVGNAEIWGPKQDDWRRAECLTQSSIGPVRGVS